MSYAILALWYSTVVLHYNAQKPSTTSVSLQL